MTGTPFMEVYDAFLAKTQEDDWAWVDDEETAKKDWLSIMESALLHIKFPRVSLSKNNTTQYFDNQLSDEEIQLIANYMKVEWLDRTIHTWENIKPYYAEADFSQANLLDKLVKLLDRTEQKANRLQHKYYRSIKGAPYPYSKLAGGR